MTKLIVAIAVLLTIAIGGWVWLKDPPGDAARIAAATPTEGGKAPHSADARDSGAAPVAAMQTSAPPRQNSTPPTAAKAPAVRLVGSAAQFARGEFKALYDRYAANPQGADAETKYYAALSLEACASRSPQKPAEARKRIEDRIAPGDPLGPQRLAAYDRQIELCKDFVGAQGDLTKLMREAAAAGSPGAKLAMMQQDFWAQRRAANPQGQSRAQMADQARLTEDQLATVRDALRSNDPAVLGRVGQLLSMTQEMSAQMATDTFRNTTAARTPSAWQLAGCDLGHNCGADSMELLGSCVWGGNCNMTSVEQNIQMNVLSPNAFLAAQQQRVQILDAIQNQRWDVLGIAPGMGRTTPLPPIPARPAPPAKPAPKG